jgi:DNA-binding NtrC family response regulator
MRAHLLLVDDETAFTTVMARRLRRRGFTVTCAADGDEALARLREDDTIEVVVLDIRMPGLDGLAALAAIKAGWPLVPVVMLTGHATVATAVAAMQAGAFDYLAKPCDLEALAAKALEAARHKRRHEELLREARTRPYITRRQREALIARLLEAARRPRAGG